MADVDTLPTLPTSTLDIPLTYDLTPIVRALENSVPKTFGDIDERKQLANPRMQIAFEATRDPFTVSLDGQTAGSMLSSTTKEGASTTAHRPEHLELMRDQRHQATSAHLDHLEPSYHGGVEAARSHPVASVAPYSDERRDQCRSLRSASM